MQILPGGICSNFLPASIWEDHTATASNTHIRFSALGHLSPPQLHVGVCCCPWGQSDLTRSLLEQESVSCQSQLERWKRYSSTLGLCVCWCVWSELWNVGFCSTLRLFKCKVHDKVVGMTLLLLGAVHVQCCLFFPFISLNQINICRLCGQSSNSCKCRDHLLQM